MAWLVPTLKKIGLTAVGLVSIYVGAAQLGLGGSEANLLAASLIAGMLFPDIDIFTGALRSTLKAALLAIFMVLAVVFFPSLTSLAAPVCPATAIHQYLGDVDPLVACQLGVALLAVLAAWALSEVAVMAIPAKESFHHWTNAILVSGGVALVAYSVKLTTNTELVSIGFIAGYALHLIGDWGKEKADDEALKRKLGFSGGAAPKPSLKR